MVSLPPRPSVVTSLLSWLTPWKPATSTMLPSSSAFRSRCGVTCTIRASPCFAVVIIPAWEPVNEIALAPSAEIAIATSALLIRSPAVSSMSISRGGGRGTHLLGEVEQLVGGVAHRGDDHDDVVALFVRTDDPLGDPLDAVGVLDRRSAVLLHDEGHRRPPRVFASSKLLRGARSVGHCTVRVRHFRATPDRLVSRSDASRTTTAVISSQASAAAP